MSHMNSEDKYYRILRCLISLGYIDGKISSLEKKWLKQMIKRHLTKPEYINQLVADFENPLTYEQSFRLLNNFHHRELVLNYARHLFVIDECLSADEKFAFQKMNEIHKELGQEILKEQPDAAAEIAKSIKRQRFDVEVSSAGRILRKRPEFIFMHSPYIIFFGGLFFDLRAPGARIALIVILLAILLIGSFSLLMISQ